MASTEKLRLEIVTPKGLVLSEDVEEVVAPSVRGEFGVLPGRLPMLAALQIGLVHYRKVGSSEMTDVAVGHGFVEVNGDKTLVLTDRFIAKDAIEVLTVRERLKEVDEKLEAWGGEHDDPARVDLIEEEQWLAAQLEVYGDPAVARVLEFRRATDYSDLAAPPVSEADATVAEDGAELAPGDDAEQA
ncbi:MAG: ATP synthase F1 subunit epsilon [Deltaproteobacteria bacterium]|nr:ATP synthase F1 subunit epsilon [Deltaproteobacteria bacterium]